jgi:hypothetical protein
MRTLSQIVEEAESGGLPTHDECLYAMLVLGYLHHAAASDIDRGVKYGESARKFFDPREEEFKRAKAAFAAEPEKYLGSFHPQAPGRQEERALAFKILDKIEKRKKS